MLSYVQFVVYEVTRLRSPHPEPVVCFVAVAPYLRSRSTCAVASCPCSRRVKCDAADAAPPERQIWLIGQGMVLVLVTNTTLVE